LLSPATMKSIIALLLLAVCANAFTDKMGGLKGSWGDTFEVENPAPDEAAPLVDYRESTTQVLQCSYPATFSTDHIINTTELGYGTSCSVYFRVTNELTYAQTGDYDWSFDETGKVWLTFWTGADAAAPDATIDAGCYMNDGGLDVTCSFSIVEHMWAGDYKPMITTEDGLGNWAMYDETDFATADNTLVFTLQENDPDVTDPMILATSWAVTGAAVSLGGAASTLSTVVTTTISVDATDGYYYQGNGCDEDVAEYDGWSSMLMGVSVGVMSDMEGAEEMWFNMYEDETSLTSPTCYDKYELEISFWNTAEPQVWTITGVMAWDGIGNSVTWVPTTNNMITITYDEAALEEAGGVMSCQTLDLTLGDGTLDLVSITATAGDDTNVDVTMTCVEKDTWNYVAVAYQTSAYTPVGETEATRRWCWSYGSGVPYGDDYDGAGHATWDQLSNFGNYVSWAVSDPDWSPDHYAPGTVTSLGFWYANVPVYPGFPDGDYDLKSVITTTDKGGVQWYDLDLGSASSVVPSVFAVLFAAIVALLRL
jgi:hypothetical protein